jgi:predicted transcriptional regulator
MPREKRDAAVGVRMTSALKANLEKLAEADDRTLASYIERILREHVATVKAENGKPKRK